MDLNEQEYLRFEIVKKLIDLGSSNLDKILADAKKIEAYVLDQKKKED